MLTLRASYELTTNTQLSTKSTLFGGVLVITDGTNNAVVNLYDVAAAGDAAASTKVWEQTVLGSDQYGGGLFPNVIRCHNGLYITISGTGASCIVFYN